MKKGMAISLALSTLGCFASEIDVESPTYQKIVLVNEEHWYSCSAIVEGPVLPGQQLTINGFSGDQPITVKGIVMERGEAHPDIDPQGKNAVLVADFNLHKIHLAYTSQALKAGTKVHIYADGMLAPGIIIEPLH